MQRAADRLVDQVLDGTYRLGARIGEGGMGAVYAARHLGTDRPVAIKVLLPEVVGNARAVERFRREARAAGRLRHPNVVDVTDFGVAQVDGHEVAYLVMEFLEGATLRSVLDTRGALPLDVAVEVVEQVASALDAAHAAGIVHRDLKPDNVWLVPDARGGYAVRVLDFGIALLGHLDTPAGQAAPGPVEPEATYVGPAIPFGVGTPSMFDRTLVTPDDAADVAITAVRLFDVDVEDTTGRLTHVGTLVGTPSYMSPEQWQGRETTAASDTYSLGVLAWEMLAGQRPFVGGLPELAVAHQHGAIPVLEAHPAAVSAVIARAMAKLPSARYPGSGAFAGSLRVAAEGAGVVLRRAIALYASRWPEMSRVAWQCARVPIALAAVAAAGLVATLATAGMDSLPAAFQVALVVGVFGWFAVTLATNAYFALAIEQLRTRPFENLEAATLAAELRARLGLAADAGWWRTRARLAVYYARCEARAQVGTGDLAFLVGFLEGVPVADIPRRNRELAVGVKRSYRLIIAAVLAGLFVVPMLEAGLVVLAWLQFGEPRLQLAAIAGLLLLPVNAMLVNPVSSSAFALLYFRARQAHGEDVGLGGILPGRL
jgi:serine/threonine protein kinase